MKTLKLRNISQYSSKDLIETYDSLSRIQEILDRWDVHRSKRYQGYFTPGITYLMKKNKKTLSKQDAIDYIEYVLIPELDKYKDEDFVNISSDKFLECAVSLEYNFLVNYRFEYFHYMMLRLEIRDLIKRRDIYVNQRENIHGEYVIAEKNNGRTYSNEEDLFDYIKGRIFSMPDIKI